MKKINILIVLLVPFFTKLNMTNRVNGILTKTRLISRLKRVIEIYTNNLGFFYNYLWFIINFILIIIVFIYGIKYKKVDKEEKVQYRLPFGGGAGAGVSIQPIAFLVITQENVKLMPVDHTSCIDKLLDYVPDLMEKANNMINKCIQNKKEETEKVIQAMKKKESKETNEEKKDEVKKQEVKKDAKEEINKDILEDLDNYEYEYNGMEDE